MSNDLSAILTPRTIAVIGASRRRGTVGGEIFHNILANGFKGTVFPVNANTDSVHAVRAYRSVMDIPDAVDLAIVVVPRATVKEAVEACGRKRVRAVIVISAGFGEVGASGKRLQDEITALVHEHGMRMVGPNCLGVLNTAPDVCMDATFAPAWPPPGNVSFSSQSGALGAAILAHAASLGIGMRHFVSVGNKADVSGNDLLEHWESDPGTEVILLYLESLGNPAKFTQIARRVSRNKPILALKSGRTAGGMRAASSHTGSLAGSDAAVEAVFRQTGVIRANTIEELFDAAMLLANQPAPRSNRVAILTNAGGPGIMATDACEHYGLELPELADDTLAKLREFLPAEASLRNPVDMIASATGDSYGRAVTLLLDDPNVDSLMVIFVQPLVTAAEEVAKAVREGLERAQYAAEKTVLACFMGARGVPESLKTLQAGQVPSYNFPEAAALALSRAVAYGGRRARPPGRPVTYPVDTQHVRTLVDEAIGAIIEPHQAPGGDAAGEAWLPAATVQALLDAYSIRTPEAVVATSVEEAVAAANDIGYPVAVKLESRSISHKTDVGGVQLDIPHARGVEHAWAEIEAALREQGRQAEMEGTLVQRMAPAGVEVIVGATCSPSFGHLIMYGLGGVLVEVLKDVAWGVAPLTDTDAEQMVERVKGSRLLDGWRGSPKVERRCLVDLLLRVSQMVTDVPEIAEMDMNPVRILPAEDDGALVLDARIRLRSRAC